MEKKKDLKELIITVIVLCAVVLLILGFHLIAGVMDERAAENMKLYEYAMAGGHRYVTNEILERSVDSIDDIEYCFTDDELTKNKDKYLFSLWNICDAYKIEYMKRYASNAVYSITKYSNNNGDIGYLSFIMYDNDIQNNKLIATTQVIRTPNPPSMEEIEKSLLKSWSDPLEQLLSVYSIRFNESLPINVSLPLYETGCFDVYIILSDGIARINFESNGTFMYYEIYSSDKIDTWDTYGVKLVYEELQNADKQK